MTKAPRPISAAALSFARQQEVTGGRVSRFVQALSAFDPSGHKGVGER